MRTKVLLVTSLLLGATMFLYDGAPDFPAPDREIDAVERHHVAEAPGATDDLDRRG